MGVEFPRELEESAELLSVEGFDNVFVRSPDSLCASIARAGLGSEIILTATMAVHLAFSVKNSAPGTMIGPTADNSAKSRVRVPHFKRIKALGSSGLATFTFQLIQILVVP